MNVSIFNNSPKGYIGFYSLQNWWKKSFSKKERKSVADRVDYTNIFTFELLKGTVKNENMSVSFFLTLCADIFNNHQESHIAERFIEHSILLLTDNIIDQHYAYGTAIDIYIKDYESNKKKIISYSKKQIAISEFSMVALKKSFMFPLGHSGYENLTYLLREANKIKESNILLQKAIQQGWLGNWKKQLIPL